MDKLIELDAAGVTLIIYSPSFFYGSSRGWNIVAKKEEDGTKLEIEAKGPNLADVVEEVYDKWLAATRGLPRHGLRQLTLQAEPASPVTSGLASGSEEPPAAKPSIVPDGIDWKKELDDEIPY